MPGLAQLAVLAAAAVESVLARLQLIELLLA
jgi:hypothetical protein